MQRYSQTTIDDGYAGIISSSRDLISYLLRCKISSSGPATSSLNLVASV
jgi:hypothetical protein